MVWENVFGCDELGDGLAGERSDVEGEGCRENVSSCRLRLGVDVL